jgi:hypothetical protein
MAVYVSKGNSRCLGKIGKANARRIVRHSVLPRRSGLGSLINRGCIFFDVENDEPNKAKNDR